MKLLPTPWIWAWLVLATPLLARAQPTFGAFQFSNGVHPAVDAVFEQAGNREVERFWLAELKNISAKVTGKKELIGHAARIPAASPDTIRILVSVEKPKGSLYTTAHLAFLTSAGYVGPDSPGRERDGCMEWVRQRTTVLQRQLAQAEVDRQKKTLDNLNRDMDMLRRDQQRAEDNLQRSEQRLDQAAKDSTDASREIALHAEAIAGMDSTARATATKQGTKDKAMREDRLKRAERTRASTARRIEDLRWTLKRNADDRMAKQARITAQEAALRSAREKLQAIR